MAGVRRPASGTPRPASRRTCKTRKDAGRLSWDEARIICHPEMLAVALAPDAHQPPRDWRGRGMIVSGPQSTWTSTAIKQFGRMHEPRITAAFPLLRLHQHEPGTLVRHSQHLQARTSGMIGGPFHLARATAGTAILEGTEKTGLALLKSTLIDYSAEADAPHATQVPE